MSQEANIDYGLPAESWRDCSRLGQLQVLLGVDAFQAPQTDPRARL